jgi:chloramphenicol O-acetyltransferase type A
MKMLPEFTKLDMDTWPRATHFRYYQEQIPCEYSLTVQENVTELLAFVHRSGKNFTAGLLYAVCRVVNAMDCMRMMVSETGEPGIWTVSHPNFTVFHDDDKTFSDLWMKYEPDFQRFCKEYVKVKDEYGNSKGVKGRPDQPANFFCFSCVPWIRYIGYANGTAGGRRPHLFPSITCGKYEKDADGKYMMPVTLTISHAAADGYQASMFFQRLQQTLTEICSEK